MTLTKTQAFDLLVAEGVEVVKARKAAYDSCMYWMEIAEEVAEKLSSLGATQMLDCTRQLEAFLKSCEVAGLNPTDDAFAVVHRMMFDGIRADAAHSAEVN